MFTKKRAKEITDCYFKNKQDMAKTTKELGITDESVVRAWRVNKTPIKQIKTKNTEDLKKQIEYYENKISELTEITETPSKFTKIKSEPSIKNEAIPIVCLSDIHAEEKVEAEKVYHLNKYNTDICEKRLELFFSNLLKLVKKERQDITIDKLVLAMLGDMITGYIHEELMESNYLSPVEATIFIKVQLLRGLKFISENGKFKEITIPTCRGNHSRTTNRQRISTDYENNFETLLYNSLSKDCEKLGLSNIKFILSKANMVYLQVFDKIIRFAHGNQFKYKGGIGGITIPLYKWIYRSNGQKQADKTFIGHYHSFLNFEECMLNGSLIGANSYSIEIGMKPEKPKQIFQLLDKKREWTVTEPILCYNPDTWNKLYY